MTVIPSFMQVQGSGAYSGASGGPRHSSRMLAIRRAGVLLQPANERQGVFSPSQHIRVRQECCAYLTKLCRRSKVKTALTAMALCALYLMYVPSEWGESLHACDNAPSVPNVCMPNNSTTQGVMQPPCHVQYNAVEVVDPGG